MSIIGQKLKRSPAVDLFPELTDEEKDENRVAAKRIIEGINGRDFLQELKPILASCVGSDYARHIASDDIFFAAVLHNVEETSAWKDEGYYTDDDIRLAIGRVFLDYLGIEY